MNFSLRIKTLGFYVSSVLTYEKWAGDSVNAELP